MSDPSLALSDAMEAALKASAPLAALVGGRIYDRVPRQPAPAFPYLRYAVVLAVQDDDGCGLRWDVQASVHCWSEEPGRRQALALAALVRPLIDVKLDLGAGFRTNIHQFLNARPVDDGDGVRTQVIVEMRYNIAQT